MTEPASVQLPRVSVSTIATVIGVAISTLVGAGALLNAYYNYAVSKTKTELYVKAIDARLGAMESKTEIQTNAITAVDRRLDHMDDTIAHLQVQATPKHQ